MSASAVKTAADKSEKLFFAFIFGSIAIVLFGVVYSFREGLTFFGTILLLLIVLDIWVLIALPVGLFVGLYLRGRSREYPVCNSETGGGDEPL